MNSPCKQLCLFDLPALRLGAVGRMIKAALNKAAMESDLSREEIVHKAGLVAQEAGINLCPGGGLSLATFNKWLDANAGSHMPTIYGLIVVCQVLENDQAFVSLLGARGLEIMSSEDSKYRDYGKAVMELKNARKRIKKVEDTL